MSSNTFTQGLLNSHKVRAWNYQFIESKTNFEELRINSESNRGNTNHNLMKIQALGTTRVMIDQFGLFWDLSNNFLMLVETDQCKYSMRITLSFLLTHI